MKKLKDKNVTLVSKGEKFFLRAHDKIELFQLVELKERHNCGLRDTRKKPKQTSEVLVDLSLA